MTPLATFPNEEAIRCCGRDRQFGRYSFVAQIGSRSNGRSELAGRLGDDRYTAVVPQELAEPNTWHLLKSSNRGAFRTDYSTLLRLWYYKF